MEIKCKICGTINDGETNFCKGCFVKLDEDKPVVTSQNDSVVGIPIEEEPEIVVPWGETNDDLKPIAGLFNEFSESDIDKTSDWVQPELKPISELENEKEEQFSDLKIDEKINESEIIEEPKVISEIAEEIKPIIEEEKLNNVEEVKPIVEESIINNEIEESTKENNSEDAIIDEVNSKEVELSNEPIINDDWGFDATEIPVEVTDNIEGTTVEVNEEISSMQQVEDSIPELSEFDNWNNSNDLPTLDLNQFNMDKEEKWDNEVDETEVKEDKYKYVGIASSFFKFLLYCLIFGLLFGALCIGFRYIMTHIFNMGTRGELIFIVVSSITTVATLLISTDMTFKKTIPLASKLNTTSILILLFGALPYILIKLAFNLYIGTTLVILLILIALLLIILALFFNYIRSSIRKKHDIKGDDKLTFLYGIFNIILIGICIFGVFMYKDKDKNMSFDILINDTENKQMVMQYIYQTEADILRRQTEITDYEIPTIITDVRYADINGETPSEMTLYINENGGVTSGEVVYNNKTYTYNGEIVEAK